MGGKYEIRFWEKESFPQTEFTNCFLKFLWLRIKHWRRLVYTKRYYE